MTGELVKKHNYMTPHQMERSLKSLELYLDGHRWGKIHALGGYSWREFSFMMAKYPDLAKSYQEARRASGHSFEDKALWLAEELTSPNEFTGTQVQAHKAAMEQYRWSAARRNPTEYAEAGAKQISVVVPIQINSSLDLADGHSDDQPKEISVWEAHAEIVDAAAETPKDARDDPEVESTVEGPETAPSGLPVALEGLRTQLGLPLEVPAAIKRRPPTGQPRKGHKNANRTSISRTRMLQKSAKNPTVARALGLDKDLDDGRTTGHDGDTPSGPKPDSGS